MWRDWEAGPRAGLGGVEVLRGLQCGGVGGAEVGGVGDELIAVYGDFIRMRVGRISART